MGSVVVLLVEMLASSRQAGQLFVQDVLLGAHAVVFHVLGPVQLSHIKVKRLNMGKYKNIFGLSHTQTA